MDIGYNSNVGLECVIASLRDEQDFLKKSEKLRNTTLRKVLKKQTLKDASNSAFNALDLVAEGITWDELRSKHSMQDIIDFGTTFAIAKSIGLKCKYYGGDNGLHILKQMNATDEQIKESITSLQDIKDAQWSADTVKQAGFQIEDLINLGNVKSELSQQKGWSIKEIVLAFNPTGDEWVQAGYKNEENCDAAQFKTFVQPKTATMNVDYQYKKKETEKMSSIRVETVQETIPSAIPTETLPITSSFDADYVEIFLLVMIFVSFLHSLCGVSINLCTKKKKA